LTNHTSKTKKIGIITKVVSEKIERIEIIDDDKGKSREIDNRT
jgi:hypothetical protein